MTRTKPNKPNKQEQPAPVKKEKVVAYLQPGSVTPVKVDKQLPKDDTTKKVYRAYVGKDNSIIKERIIEMVEADSYTLVEICNAVGISNFTYYEWLKEDTVFSNDVKKASQRARMNFCTIAKNSLRRLIEGYEATDITVSEKLDRQGNKITVTSKTTKIYKPDTAAVIFTLTNVDPDNWKNRQNVSGEITNTNVVTFEDLEDTMKDLSDEQLFSLRDIALTVKKLKTE